MCGTIKMIPLGGLENQVVNVCWMDHSRDSHGSRSHEHGDHEESHGEYRAGYNPGYKISIDASEADYASRSNASMSNESGYGQTSYSVSYDNESRRDLDNPQYEMPRSSASSLESYTVLN